MIINMYTDVSYTLYSYTYDANLISFINIHRISIEVLIPIHEVSM